MHRIIRQLAIFLLAACVVLAPLLLPSVAEAQVHVRGYFRKNGTYVQPHYRSAPDGNPYNNYSYPGNLNPYTGKIAPGDPETYLRNYYGRRQIAPSADDRVGLRGIDLWFPSATTGAERRALAAAQVALGILGHYNDVVDGKAGPKTRAALASFQVEKGIAGSGTLDSKTAEVLIDAIQKLPADSPAFARQFSVEPAAPTHASPSPYGPGWVCDRGYRSTGNECALVEIPRNASLDSYGHDWVCERGYRRSGSSCTEVVLPANAFEYGDSWMCNTGYRRSGNGCEQIPLPANAFVYGESWMCNTGYRRSGSGCEQIRLPPNAFVYGEGWMCNTGYKRSGNGCEQIRLPANAFVYGEGWMCNSGYRRSGDSCEQIQLPANAFVYGEGWMCSSGYRRVGAACIPE